MQEEAATENKQEHTNNVVGTGDGDIGSPGHNLIDSTKVYYLCPKLPLITMLEIHLFFT
jgi:hypothetical protein